MQVLLPNDLMWHHEMNIIPSTQSIYTTFYMSITDKYWGVRRAWSCIRQNQPEAGAHLASSTNSPVESRKPALGNQIAVSHRRADRLQGHESWHLEYWQTTQESVEDLITEAVNTAYAERDSKLTRGYLVNLITF